MAALATSPARSSAAPSPGSSVGSLRNRPLQSTLLPCRPAASGSYTPSNNPPTLSSSSASSSSSTGIVGNDRLDPQRLSLNNGIHHGEYIIGPPVQPVNGTPVKNISEYIAKREGTDDFVVLKVLTLSGSNTTTNGRGGGATDSSVPIANGDGDRGNDDNQGRMLLYNELSVLSLLQDQLGVVHQHGFFIERNHVILVLDCLVGHQYDKHGRYKDLENLQHYVIRQKKLAEREALDIFSSALSTVEALHKKNIVHRDLKLGNMVLNRRTSEVTLTNFVLSKHLVREGDELIDQRGSLAYVSPDVLSGQPYCGKASDMWAMGVLLYTMTYGQFPFYDSDPQELFKKIKTAKYTIPRDDRVSMATVVLIKQMMEIDVKKRITASRALETTLGLLSRVSTSSESESGAPAQIVPDMEDRRNSSDVPMAMKTEGIPSHPSNSLNLASGPGSMHPDSHSTHTPNQAMAFSNHHHHHHPVHIPTSPVHPLGPVPFQQGATPVHIATSPIHGGPISFHALATGQQQLLLNSDLSSAYLLTPLTPTLSSSGVNNNPFTAASSSPASSSSPSHSMHNTSPNHSVSVSSPVPIPASPTLQNTHSLPLVRTHSTTPTGCHRPVGPSQSVDSYFMTTNPSYSAGSLPSSSFSSSSSSSTPRHVRPTSLLTSGTQPHSRSVFLPSVSESGQTPENMTTNTTATAAAGTNGYIISSPVESIVTVMRSPYVEGADTNLHRHVRAASELATMAAAIIGPGTPSSSSSSSSSRPHRRRRNSSGDLHSTRVRRSSHHHHHNVQSPSAAMEATSLSGGTAPAPAPATTPQGRTRRRSHDHMERRRRSGSREPYTLNPQ